MRPGLYTFLASTISSLLTIAILTALASWAVVAFAAPAGEIAYATKGDTIRLYADVGPLPCPGGMKRAVYSIKPTGADVEGCYRIVGEQVQIAFVDGDAGKVPLSLFVFVGRPSGFDTPKNARSC